MGRAGQIQRWDAAELALWATPIQPFEVGHRGFPAVGAQKLAVKIKGAASAQWVKCLWLLLRHLSDVLSFLSD